MSRAVEARVTLRIPRGGRQELREAARDRLARASAVERVDAFDVTGVRPGLNDLRVRARTTVAADPASASGSAGAADAEDGADEGVAEDDLRAALATEVGIERVELVGGEGP
jgi:hypothetical protein